MSYGNQEVELLGNLFPPGKRTVVQSFAIENGHVFDNLQALLDLRWNGTSSRHFEKTVVLSGGDEQLGFLKQLVHEYNLGIEESKSGFSVFAPEKDLVFTVHLGGRQSSHSRAGSRARPHF